MQREIVSICEQAKKASYSMMGVSSKEKNHMLEILARNIGVYREKILSANNIDVNKAKRAKYTEAFIDRLTLNNQRIDAMIQAVEKITALPDPLGRTLAEFKRPNGLIIQRVAVPLGVVAVIYEARPNVTIDAAALCLKSGNTVILRGGQECFETTQALADIISNSLDESKLPIAAVQCIPYAERQAVDVLIQQSDTIDVLVPRGGEGLINYLSQHSKIPLFMHLSGLCHTYIHHSASLPMAIEVVVNAKMRRTGICGATETILVDESVHRELMPSIIDALIQSGCEVRGDGLIQQLDSRVIGAASTDWDTEYLAPIVSIKTVSDVNEAIAHINQHGSHHTDAILSSDEKVSALFMQQVDSAIVMTNASTQFADGGEFGMGAEIGIATGKLHARGPVGLEQLTTFKYYVYGQGQTRPI